jgi:hypothetical protein
MGKKRNAYRYVTDGKPRRKKNTRRWWKNNVKVNLREIGWEGVLTGMVWLRIGTGGELL